MREKRDSAYQPEIKAASPDWSFSDHVVSPDMRENPLPSRDVIVTSDPSMRPRPAPGGWGMDMLVGVGRLQGE